MCSAKAATCTSHVGWSGRDTKETALVSTSGSGSGHQPECSWVVIRYASCSLASLHLFVHIHFLFLIPGFQHDYMDKLQPDSFSHQVSPSYFLSMKLTDIPHHLRHSSMYYQNFNITKRKHTKCTCGLLHICHLNLEEKVLIIAQWLN